MYRWSNNAHSLPFFAPVVPPTQTPFCHERFSGDTNQTQSSVSCRDTFVVTRLTAAPVPPSWPETVMWSAFALATPAATTPTPTCREYRTAPHKTCVEVQYLTDQHKRETEPAADRDQAYLCTPQNQRLLLLLRLTDTSTSTMATACGSSFHLHRTGQCWRASSAHAWVLGERRNRSKTDGL